jgi:hypothetical protein
MADSAPRADTAAQSSSLPVVLGAYPVSVRNMLKDPANKGIVNYAQTIAARAVAPLDQAELHTTILLAPTFSSSVVLFAKEKKWARCSLKLS